MGWVFPPEGNADIPVVCMDETPRQLIHETRTLILSHPGQPERQDYEYERSGAYNVFMASEPLAGKRITKVTERKTKVDWAKFLQDIAGCYQDAQKITLVMDNLNTRSPVCYTRPSHPNRQRRSGIVSNSPTHRSTAVGSMLQRLNPT